MHDRAARGLVSSARPSNVTEAEDIGHGVKAWRLAARPDGGLERTACKDHAVLCLVHELDPLGGAGEDHVVLADRGSTAQHGEPDVACGPCTGVAVARGDFSLAKIHVAAGGGRATEQEGRSGRRIYLSV